jgi:hypothetical protein
MTSPSVLVSKSYQIFLEKGAPGDCRTLTRMVERLASRLGVSQMRLLIGGWILAAVLLLAGLALVLGGSTLAGAIVFLLGVVTSMTVAVNLLRLRAGEHAVKGRD